MSVFGNYARYYNLLYCDKDYAEEVRFVNQLLQAHIPGAQSILELGCGTGNHALLLAQEGYNIHGIDFSPEMLQQAQNMLSQVDRALKSRLKFSPGDIRNIRLNMQFDAVISLFHVVS